MTKKRVQVLLPDNITKPMGGMGVVIKQIYSNIPGSYCYDLIGTDNGKEVEHDNFNYYSVKEINQPLGVAEGLTKAFLSQSYYVLKSLTLPAPDLIHANDWSTFYAGTILSEHYNVPLIASVHLSIEHSPMGLHPLQLANKKMATAIEKTTMVKADKIIQVSKAYEELFPFAFNHKTKVIFNGIDLDEWSDPEKIRLPGKRKYKLIYIGRYAGMKNVLALLKVKLPENVDLIFIGNAKGGDVEILQKVIDKCNNSDQHHYVGAKYGKEKVNWLSSADFQIVPSTHEPFGVVALEALAAKNILLSSFAGGMNDFLNGDNAIYCGTDSKMIEYNLNNALNLTESEKAHYHKHGLELCKKLSWENQAKEYLKVYEEFLK